MRRVLSIGGKCDDCGGHIELRVVSAVEAAFWKFYRPQLLHYVIGFAFGTGGMYLCLR